MKTKLESFHKNKFCIKLIEKKSKKLSKGVSPS